MTNQAAAPLQRVAMTAVNNRFDRFQDLAEQNGLDLNPPYQRGHVWGVARRRNLIRSLLLGIPTGAIVLNDRFSAKFRDHANDRDRAWSYAVVDGKQRVSTMLAWYAGAFAVPASWFEASSIETTQGTDDGPYVAYPGLTLVGRRLFDNNASTAVLEAKVSTLAAERELFELINFGGVAQGDTDADLDD